MRCILMHKDVPVIELELDDSTGVILQTGEPAAPQMLRTEPFRSILDQTGKRLFFLEGYQFL